MSKNIHTIDTETCDSNSNEFDYNNWLHSCSYDSCLLSNNNTQNLDYNNSLIHGYFNNSIYIYQELSEININKTTSMPTVSPTY